MDRDQLLANIARRRRLPAPAARAGVSQAALGDALGVAQQTVATWEAGTRTPTGDHLAQYLDLLDALDAAVAAA